jgi:DNA topoisomerase-1
MGSAVLVLRARQEYKDRMPSPSPAISARRAGLRYIPSITEGITRQKAGGKYIYFYKGKKVTDKKTIERIHALGIPPAYQSVVISPYADTHLQAIGKDERGRNQYRYHPQWREIRDETKYHRMLEFGRALGKIRARTNADLRRPGLPREKVLATIVQLLEKTTIRIGNEQYAKENNSYGLTTLRTRHLQVEGSVIHLKFRGKSSKYHEIDLKDKRLAKIVQQLQDLPGQELFDFLDSDGNSRKLTSTDVNNILKKLPAKTLPLKIFVLGQARF